MTGICKRVDKSG